MMRKWMVVLNSTACCALACACSSSPKIEKIPDSADSATEVQLLQQDVADATNTQADILAPRAWSQTDYYMKQAQSRQADHARADRTLYSVAQSRAWLKEALATAQEAKATAPDILQVRKQALDAQARDYAGREFTAAEDSFRSYAKDRENVPGTFRINDPKRQEIRNLYMQARVIALQNRYLGDARAKIHDADKDNARSVVPHIFDQAVRSEKNASGFIANNSFDEAGIERHVDRANMDAKRLAYMTKEAHRAQGASPEQLAIGFDKMKQRNHALAGQLDSQAFQEKYEEARGAFTPSEAEVYKQGDQLLIRLKGVEFPFNHATLPASSYGLVSKVGTVIKSFGEPRVRIEGHADSIGAESRNVSLSQERAEAVKSYLLANDGLKPEMVEVEGMGFSRPIASNKSKEGRAQNRRVDVIVIPQMEPQQQIRQAL